MARVTGGKAPIINPALQDVGLFIDKLPQLTLQEITDMRRASQNFVGEQPRLAWIFAR